VTNAAPQVAHALASGFLGHARTPPRRLAPSLALHDMWAAPRYAVRSRVWSKCQGVPGWIGSPQIQQSTSPASTRGFHLSRSRWCAGPYPRAEVLTFLPEYRRPGRQAGAQYLWVEMVDSYGVPHVAQFLHSADLRLGRRSRRQGRQVASPSGNEPVPHHIVRPHTAHGVLRGTGWPIRCTQPLNLAVPLGGPCASLQVVQVPLAVLGRAAHPVACWAGAVADQGGVAGGARHGAGHHGSSVWQQVSRHNLTTVASPSASASG